MVSQRQKTTYKDVANELIDQLRRNNDMSDLAGLNDELSEGEEDEEDSSIEEYSTKRSLKSSDKKL